MPPDVKGRLPVTSQEGGPDAYRANITTPSVTDQNPIARYTEVLALSDERDRRLRRVLAAERAGFDRGYAAGRKAGYEQCDADREAGWQTIARPLADPDARRRETAARCLSAAEAGTRRDAADHERAFVARAYATPGRLRTDAQRGTVRLYPPPGRHLRSV
jgi:hypothetical protein